MLKSPNKKIPFEDSFCTFKNNAQLKSRLKSFI